MQAIRKHSVMYGSRAHLPRAVGVPYSYSRRTVLVLVGKSVRTTSTYRILILLSVSQSVITRIRMLTDLSLMRV